MGKECIIRINGIEVKGIVSFSETDKYRFEIHEAEYIREYFFIYDTEEKIYLKVPIENFYDAEKICSWLNKF